MHKQTNVLFFSQHFVDQPPLKVLTQAFRSKGVFVGSSTMNNVMMPKIAASMAGKLPENGRCIRLRLSLLQRMSMLLRELSLQ
ncbi:MAG: hypothetical protein ACOH2G_17760 [Ewingella sp.]